MVSQKDLYIGDQNRSYIQNVEAEYEAALSEASPSVTSFAIVDYVSW